jgi:nitrite reductase [NAD(P)H] small subunit
VALRVRVCAVADAPREGEHRAFAVAGVTWPVILARVDGELVAVPGVCPHEDVALADGDFIGGALICPGHAYAFDVRTGRCKHDPGLHLRRYPLTQLGDDLFADLL